MLRLLAAVLALMVVAPPAHAFIFFALAAAANKEDPRPPRPREATRATPKPLPKVAQLAPSGRGVPAWRVRLYPWKADSDVRFSDHLRSLEMRNQPFDATLGQETRTQMFVYKLEGVFQPQTSGRYVFGFDTRCGFGHPCNLIVRIGGQEVLRITKQQNLSQMLTGAVTVTEGNRYPVEIIFGLAHNNFIKWQPQRVALTVALRESDENNFRDFRAGELVPATN
ncbi:hypothetical protein [Rhodoplanes sp. SY1]|uniref:hypothetical protein n=1 Tax=Rhodoplanes sp. SY1 TaxID=3166646 RepID=UPI0038B5DF6B